MNRSEAIAAGLKQYDAGKPCPHGHGTVRFVRNSGCCECEHVNDALRSERRRIEAGQKATPRRLRTDYAPKFRQQMSKEAIETRSRARGTEKSVRGDGRHEYLRVEAAALLDSFLVVPDFLARCEERLQAVRAQS